MRRRPTPLFRRHVSLRLTVAGAPGFTLVELLIALMILGLLSAILFANLGFGTRAVTAASAVLDRSSQTAVAYAFLRSALSDAQALPDPDLPLRDQAIAFDGEKNRLEFTTLAPAYLAPGGFHRLRLELTGKGRSRRLIVTWQPITRGIGTGDPPEVAPSVLIDGLGSVEFAYCCGGARSQATEAAEGSATVQPNWSDRWADSDGLPALIRMHLTFADGWQPPDLVVAPREASRR